MPRIARCVAPGAAHHITQRGTARQLVFRTRADRLVYLDLLREQAGFASVSVLAYCLMPNHIHMIAVPPEEDSLAILFRRVHGRFAQYFNARRSRCGHLWQNRFYSCPMGPAHLWTAIRYVESNPMRAGLAEQPVDYEWSSAEAHFSGHDRRRLLDMEFFRRSGGVENWRQLFGMPAPEAEYRRLRKSTHAGQPLGDELFLESIRFQQQARKPMTGAVAGDCPPEELTSAAG
ncbi:transposase [Paludibaculum fermentans]|uniref:transposase n=1 Tax=Paludibaculum fermentans TaxID=1473598 RepID=UPI003EBABF98